MVDRDFESRSGMRSLGEAEEVSGRLKEKGKKKNKRLTNKKQQTITTQLQNHKRHKKEVKTPGEVRRRG